MLELVGLLLRANSGEWFVVPLVVGGVVSLAGHVHLLLVCVMFSLMCE